MTKNRKHILIVEARFYEGLADGLVKEAVNILNSAGTSYDRISVPGAFEIPGAIRFALETGKYDGYIALGCVIRGETTHYDYVCEESARGLNELAVHYQAAIGYGIVTVENEAQARARIFGGKRSTGAAAARACLHMVELKRKFTFIEAAA